MHKYYLKAKQRKIINHTREWSLQVNDFNLIKFSVELTTLSVNCSGEFGKAEENKCNCTRLNLHKNFEEGGK